MHTDYSDITSKIGEPLWYDEHGTPRYCAFSPNACGVYVDRVALLEISCQECERLFHVALSTERHPSIGSIARQALATNKRIADLLDSLPEPTLETLRWALQSIPLKKQPYPSLETENAWAWGDPPYHTEDLNEQPCYAGSTMTSDTLRILEFWEKDTSFSFQRQPEYEISFL